MKLINIKSLKKFAIVMLTIIVASCADENLKPIVTFDDAGHGAYPKLINEQGERSVDFFDLDNSQYTYSIEFIDDDNGNGVATYFIELTYVDVNGVDSQGPIEYKTFDAASFGTSANGNKSIDNVLIKATEMIAAVGLVTADISQADKFIINGTLVMTNGDLHTGKNSSSTIHGAAFQGHFDITLAVVCPSDLEGTHTYVGTAGWCGGGYVPTSGTTVWVREANGVFSVEDKDYSFGAYDGCYGDGSPGSGKAWPEGNLRINDLCNQLFWTGASQWGEIYFFDDVTVNGAELTLVWHNDYGEGGTSIITREGGVDWPPLTF